MPTLSEEHRRALSEANRGNPRVIAAQRRRFESEITARSERIKSLFDANPAMTDVELGEVLGCSAPQAARHRRAAGIKRSARNSRALSPEERARRVAVNEAKREARRAEKVERGEQKRRAEVRRAELEAVRVAKRDEKERAKAARDAVCEVKRQQARASRQRQMESARNARNAEFARVRAERAAIVERLFAANPHTTDADIAAALNCNLNVAANARRAAGFKLQPKPRKQMPADDPRRRVSRNVGGTSPGERAAARKQRALDARKRAQAERAAQDLTDEDLEYELAVHADREQGESKCWAAARAIWDGSMTVKGADRVAVLRRLVARALREDAARPTPTEGRLRARRNLARQIERLEAGKSVYDVTA